MSDENSAQQVVLVGGCFDVLHYGHIQFLKAAKARGNFLIVALESDEFIKTHKHRIPVHTQAERKIILEALRYVDKVIPLPFFATTEEYKKLVQTVHPTVIAITEQDPQEDNKRQMAADIGAELAVVTPLIKPFSTTHILTSDHNN
ncbi:MAG: adenylyltransferase/cytidyltransferase family protein [Patescibacteria group bacterium]|jgi:cytidyltransferase-like protein